MAPFTVSFPPQAAERAGDEVVRVAFDDGRSEDLRIHDYDRVFSIPGLYEEVVQARLECRSPDQVAGMLATAAVDLGRTAADTRVLDVGAGNGVSGEALAAHGLRPVVGIDILPEAREATLRDRPGLYDLYVTGDLLALGAADEAAIRALAPNALSCVGAIGSGHLPREAFAAALDLLAGDALVAFTVDPTLSDPTIDALLALVGELEAEGRLQELDRRRYRHRLTVTGGERVWDAIAARLRA